MKSKITIHNNVNEMHESQALYIAQQNPLDRLKETVELILRIYPIDEKKIKKNIIYFDSI